MAQETILGGLGVYWSAIKLSLNNMFTELYGLTDKYYCEFYAYNKSIPLNITVQDTYNAIHLVTAGDIVEGLCNGWSFNAGRSVDANITSEASGTGGKLRVVCSAAHSLVTGDLVVCGGMNNAAHNKPTRVTIDGTNPTTEFLCDDITYVAGAGTSAGFIDIPAHLRSTGAGSPGVYQASFNITGTADSINKLWKFELNQEITGLDNIVTERNSTATLATMATNPGHINVALNDRIWISAKNISGTDDYTIKHMNLSLTKL